MFNKYRIITTYYHILILNNDKKKKKQIIINKLSFMHVINFIKENVSVK